MDRVLQRIGMTTTPYFHKYLLGTLPKGQELQEIATDLIAVNISWDFDNPVMQKVADGYESLPAEQLKELFFSGIAIVLSTNRLRCKVELASLLNTAAQGTALAAGAALAGTLTGYAHWSAPAIATAAALSLVSASRYIHSRTVQHREHLYKIRNQLNDVLPEARAPYIWANSSRELPGRPVAWHRLRNVFHYWSCRRIGPAKDPEVAASPLFGGNVLDQFDVFGRIITVLAGAAIIKRRELMAYPDLIKPQKPSRKVG